MFSSKILNFVCRDIHHRCPLGKFGSLRQNHNSTSIPQWSLKSLKKELEFQNKTIFKKVVKFNERFDRYQFEINNGKQLTESNFDPIQFTQDLENLKKKLHSILELEQSMTGIKSPTDPNFLKIVQGAIDLGLSSSGAEIINSKKPSPVQPRLPYLTYTSQDGIPIRVGRTAKDNDLLSLSPDHRDGQDWWLHTEGVAGSHVVVRYTEHDLPTKYKETIKDAALLAAVNSKAPQGGRVSVHLTRCKHVTKPPDAKPGLVQLSQIHRPEIVVNIPNEKIRLERLLATKSFSSS